MFGSGLIPKTTRPRATPTPVDLLDINHMKHIGIILVASIVIWTIPAVAVPVGKYPEVISGKVFLDANENGRQDDGEAGIPGVRVTDGVGFAISAADGSYEIRIAADPAFPGLSARTVSVCWTNKTWPAGPWWIRLSAIDEPQAVNFALKSDGRGLPFSYLHMSDPHEHFNHAHMDFAKFVNGLPADVRFILDTGDSYRPKSAEDPFKLLFFSTVGNHDTWEGPDVPPDGIYAQWTNRLGPVRWSFDHAGIHFVGVNVIDETKSEAMIDWLEKDLAAVATGKRVVMGYHYPDPTGNERFSRLLAKHKVEIIHAGHNHAYSWRDGGLAPMVTAYHWGSPGTCNIAMLSDHGIDIGVYCIGCKRTAGRHSRRCPITWEDHIMQASIASHITKVHTLDPGPVAGVKPLKLTAPHACVEARIDPAGASRVSVRLGGGDDALEISFTDGRLVVDGASAPFSLRPGQETLDLTIFAHHDMLTVWANNYYFIEKPVSLKKVAEVGVTAESGAAAIRSMTVREIKTDPSNSSSRYFCPCGHGSLRRNAVSR